MMGGTTLVGHILKLLLYTACCLHIEWAALPLGASCSGCCCTLLLCPASLEGMPRSGLCLQVRSAATIGGNLVLAKRMGLESDLATLFMAAGAQVGVLSCKTGDVRSDTRQT